MGGQKKIEDLYDLFHLVNYEFGNQVNEIIFLAKFGYFGLKVICCMLVASKLCTIRLIHSQI